MFFFSCIRTCVSSFISSSFFPFLFLSPCFLFPRSSVFTLPPFLFVRVPFVFLKVWLLEAFWEARFAVIGVGVPRLPSSSLFTFPQRAPVVYDLFFAFPGFVQVLSIDRLLFPPLEGEVWGASFPFFVPFCIYSIPPLTQVFLLVFSVFFYFHANRLFLFCSPDF